jgi:hypothetical protein
MFRVYETVICIVTGVQGSDAIEFAKKDCRQQVIHGIRVLGVALGNLRELLNRPLMVHVVEMLEGSGVERIRRTEGEFRLSERER